MRFLFTADWQCDWENIDLCERAAADVLRICSEEKLEGFAVIGDLKKAYNPVDIRVVKFWTDFIHTADRECLKVVLNLGNHDRVGMYSEAQNWFSILQKAGAKVVHSGPTCIRVEDGVLCCLPYSSSIETTKLWAKDLVKQKQEWGYKDLTEVLLFHQDIQNAEYNMLGQQSSAKLKPSDLLPDKYSFCFGGHIHLRQSVTPKIWYVGSPFVTDWGEANQKKSYTLVKNGQRFIRRSSIPGWYDPSWPGMPTENDWKGSRVRIHVPLEVGQNYPAVLEKARIDAEKKYKGATVYTVPDFKEEKQSESQFKVNDPDSVKIEAYVNDTLPENLDKHRAAINSYLAYKLNKASAGSGLRMGGKVTFLSALARKFLSYDELHVGFNLPGLHLITGKNRDWMDRSNGSGKSNMLQPIPVALFGRTFKDQRHDAWACDKRKGLAEVRLVMKDSKGRIIRVVRTRRPGKLQLFVDGKEQSSGMQSTSKDGTQGLVERVTGFTWQTLANAVYIDQEQVNLFLTGRPSDQKKILERFQNLERFTRAQELIAKDCRVKGVAIYDATSERDIAEASVDAYKDVLEEQEIPVEKEDAERKLREARDALVKAKDRMQLVVPKIRKKIEKVNRHIGTIGEEGLSLGADILAVKSKKSVLEERIVEAHKAVGKSTCPTCLQKVDPVHLQKHIQDWESELTVATKELSRLRLAEKGLADEDTNLTFRLKRLNQIIEDYREAVDDAQDQVNKCKDQKEDVRNDWEQEQDRRKKLKKKIRDAKRQVAFWISQLNILTEEKAILDYCSNAFSRNGVPAFLNAQICPALNKAAEFYSDIFTGKEIQVRFAVKEAEFEVEVVNAHGGRTIVDQSAGEKKMAAIIASFALRSIAPPCNLLVLDEPGDGLDATNAKAFASGLKKLRNQLGTVLLTTHNPHILSELSGEKVITVEKKNGVSSIV